MEIYDQYHELGKKNMKSTKNDFLSTIGEEGIKDIIVTIFLGGNVRDFTEFVTQRRLLNSYASTLELFTNVLHEKTYSIDEYALTLTNALKSDEKKDIKLLYLWLLGLTNKGLDNIVRGNENIDNYRESFSFSMKESLEEIESVFGPLSGKLKIGETEIDLNWKFISLFLLSTGSQTLTIRGSSKSMNGKLFEKLVMGSILEILGFKYYPDPPSIVNETEPAFWLSHMDESEREIDATVIYNKIAISIDIGFIGKGNPEITLDKVTRFGAYKNIGGIPHDMSTIIIVDTVGDNSDLFNKAERVNGTVLQMKHTDWIIQLANVFKDKLNLENSLIEISTENLPEYLSNKMKTIDIVKYFI